eukprot:TRINITY_DN20961_c0_g1_i1.p1 TRINITY_DN20961_c0_g1~~TRINITY_DN20961_c0_g1_i1.p1  ORF type:complete len:315 (+),score=36.36 TRINITY_DN20961_c0_g1_i1:46-945(+)
MSEIVLGPTRDVSSELLSVDDLLEGKSSVGVSAVSTTVEAPVPTAPAKRRIITPGSTPADNRAGISPTRGRKREVTIIREVGEPLGLVLEHMILQDVKKGSPADRCGSASAIGLRLTVINNQPVESEQQLLDVLSGSTRLSMFSFLFEECSQDSRWSMGNPHHVMKTPVQEIYPPTYLHPPPEGRTVPLPTTTTPLFLAGGFGLGSPDAPLDVLSARARSEMVCARAYGGTGPLSSGIPGLASHTNTYRATDRSPFKFHPESPAIREYWDTVTEVPAPIGVGDSNVGLSNRTLPPWIDQ